MILKNIKTKFLDSILSLEIIYLYLIINVIDETYVLERTYVVMYVFHIFLCNKMILQCIIKS